MDQTVYVVAANERRRGAFQKRGDCQLLVLRRLWALPSHRNRHRPAPGAVVGEFALISIDKTRTQTLQCTEAGELLEITYGQVKQLYYQNPTFGFSFLQLTSGRLFENIKRLELEVAQLRAQLAALSRGSQAAPG